MKFRSGTAFMKAAEMPVVARMLDDAGFHGLLVSDHLIYPKGLKTVYPGHESGKPFWSPETGSPSDCPRDGCARSSNCSARTSTTTGTSTERNDPGAARTVEGRMGLVPGRVLRHPRDDHRTPPAEPGTDPVPASWCRRGPTGRPPTRATTITSSAPPSSTARRSRTSPRGSSRSSRERNRKQ